MRKVLLVSLEPSAPSPRPLPQGEGVKSSQCFFTASIASVTIFRSWLSGGSRSSTRCQ